MKKYFVVEDGNPVGPFSLNELRARDIAPQDLVWMEGMEGWEPAETIDELSPLFDETEQPDPQPPYQQPQYQQPPYQQPQYQQPPYQQQQYQQPPYQQPPYGRPAQGYYTPVKTYKTFAIIVTVLGFLTSCLGGAFGVLAIINANKAEGYLKMGQEMLARQSASTAKTWCIVGGIAAALGLVYQISIFSAPLWYL